MEYMFSNDAGLNTTKDIFLIVLLDSNCYVDSIKLQFYKTFVTLIDVLLSFIIWYNKRMELKKQHLLRKWGFCGIQNTYFYPSHQMTGSFFQTVCGYKTFSISTKFWKRLTHTPGKTKSEIYINLTKVWMRGEMNAVN